MENGNMSANASANGRMRMAECECESMVKCMQGEYGRMRQQHIERAGRWRKGMVGVYGIDNLWIV
jgi:hypothetical protein